MLMSRDKSDYARFEMRLERAFDDRLNDWIEANAPGTPKSVIVRQQLEKLMSKSAPEDAALSDEMIAIIDAIRARYPIPSRRNDIVKDALQKYINLLDNT